MDKMKELYIEPTSECNLHCAMCSRNHWENESTGHMDLALFDKVMGEISDRVDRIFFGGIGEPLCHPDILYMIRRAKETDRTVEMITNGTMLNEYTINGILETGLDKLWVSLDSMEADSYENIRSGAKFSSVMDNIRLFNDLRFPANRDFFNLDLAKTKLGIAFVLMKDNLMQYKKLLQRSYFFGIADVKATHLIPYDESQSDQILYHSILGTEKYGPPSGVCVNMPLMDTRDIQQHELLPVFSHPLMSFSFMGNPLQRRTNYCRFVQERILYVRWDGEICPCMALLHDNTVYQQDDSRYSHHCSFGNAHTQSISEIWNNDAYSRFRQRVLQFDFSPCTYCGTCDLFKTNEEDCYGNAFPTCGGCLWAQGLIQCP